MGIQQQTQDLLHRELMWAACTCSIGVEELCICSQAASMKQALWMELYAAALHTVC